MTVMESHGMPCNCDETVTGLEYLGVMELTWLYGTAMKLPWTAMGIAVATTGPAIVS